jgi:hypothetical protein
MNSAEASYNTPSPAVFSQVVQDDEEVKEQNGKEEKKADQKVEDVKDSDIPADVGMSLANFYPPAQKLAVSCIKSITYSGWNPPPGNRKLSGIILPLRKVTLDRRFDLPRSYNFGKQDLSHHRMEQGLLREFYNCNTFQPIC